MSQAGSTLGRIVIDLSSDNESEDDDRQVEADSSNTVDLTDVSDIGVLPDEPRLLNDQNHSNPDRGSGVGLMTEAACLQMVLNVLPAISVDYVLNLIRAETTDQTRTVAQCERIILRLLEGKHPTEVEAVNKLKRKREDNDEDISRTAQGQYRHPQYYDKEA